MFGFLKDKLKKAVKKFSTEAEEDVVEEKVEDSAVIEEAKEAEKKIVTKVAKKPTPKKEPISTPVKKKQDKVKPTPQKVKQVVEKQKSTPESEELPVEETPEPTEVTPAKEVEKPPEKKGFFGKIFGKKEEVVESTPEPEEVEQPATELREEILEETQDDVLKEPVVKETKPEATGFFGKLKDNFTKKSLSEEKFDELFWELEIAMMENNVAVEVIEKIKQDLKDELTSGKVNRMGIEDMILARLQQSIEELFSAEGFDLIAKIKAGQKPYKLCIIGVNGSGKTTTLAKIVHKLQGEGLSVVVAASDTFRAAAIDQLREHTDKLSVKLISQGYGADPAAVAFDAIEHAKAKGLDVVLIDTAGRLHSNNNLMAELEKVVRVAKPDLKIFVGESITGNDCIEQAKVFDERVGIDGIILSKADIDEKGGTAISVSYVTGKPILYLGTGQKYDDLEEFDKEKIIANVGL